MTEQPSKSCKITLDEILETEWTYTYIHEVTDKVLANSRENIKPRLKSALLAKKKELQGQLQAKKKELQIDIDELQEAIEEIDSVIDNI